MRTLPSHQTMPFRQATPQLRRRCGVASAASQPVRCGPAVGTAPVAKRTRRLRLEAQRAVQAVSAPAGGRPPPSSDAWFRARGGAGRRGRRGAANTGPPPATADGGGAAEGSGSGGDILLKGTPGAISLAEMTALRVSGHSPMAATARPCLIPAY